MSSVARRTVKRTRMMTHTAPTVRSAWILRRMTTHFWSHCLSILGCNEGKMRTLIAVMLVSTLCAAQHKTARQYYDELVKAGGLYGMTNEFACFNDDAADETFWTFSKSEDLAELLSATPTPSCARSGRRCGRKKPRGTT